MIGGALITLVRVLMALYAFALTSVALLALAWPDGLDSDGETAAAAATPFAGRVLLATAVLVLAAFLALEPRWLRTRPRLLWPLAAVAASLSAFAASRAWLRSPADWLEWTALLAAPGAAQAALLLAAPRPPATPTPMP